MCNVAFEFSVSYSFDCRGGKNAVKILLADVFPLFIGETEQKRIGPEFGNGSRGGMLVERTCFLTFIAAVYIICTTKMSIYIIVVFYALVGKTFSGIHSVMVQCLRGTSILA